MTVINAQFDRKANAILESICLINGNSLYSWNNNNGQLYDRGGQNLYHEARYERGTPNRT